MSVHKQGDEAPSAGAPAAPAPTAGERQESKRHALEKDMLELKAKIEELETEIAADKPRERSLGLGFGTSDIKSTVPPVDPPEDMTVAS